MIIKNKHKLGEKIQFHWVYNKKSYKICGKIVMITTKEYYKNHYLHKTGGLSQDKNEPVYIVKAKNQIGKWNTFYCIESAAEEIDGFCFINEKE